FLVEGPRELPPEGGRRPVEHRGREGQRLQADPPAVHRLEARGNVVEHRADPGDLVRAAPHEALAPPVFHPRPVGRALAHERAEEPERKSTRLNSSHVAISYAAFCSVKKTSMRVGANAGTFRFVRVYRGQTNRPLPQ